jgi:voltage-gated potassium channel
MARIKTQASAQSIKNESIYGLFILALTVFSLLMVVAYFLLPLTDATKQALLWLDLPVILIFLADSFACLRRAPSKRAYIKWGWLDFLGSIPLLLPLRFARLRRFVQIWRILQLRRLSQVGDDLDENRAQAAALLMVLLAIMVLTAATVVALEFESQAPESNIVTAGDAFWWSIVTMATVGYGDYYPITVGGRIAAVALMTVGVGIFGVLASFLANLFLPQVSKDDEDPAGAPEPVGDLEPDKDPNLDEIQAELAAVNSRLDDIQALLGDRVLPPGNTGTESN